MKVKSKKTESKPTSNLNNEPEKVILPPKRRSDEVAVKKVSFYKHQHVFKVKFN